MDVLGKHLDLIIIGEVHSGVLDEVPENSNFYRPIKNAAERQESKIIDIIRKNNPDLILVEGTEVLLHPGLNTASSFYTKNLVRIFGRKKVKFIEINEVLLQYVGNAEKIRDYAKIPKEQRDVNAERRMKRDYLLSNRKREGVMAEIITGNLASGMTAVAIVGRNHVEKDSLVVGELRKHGIRAGIVLIGDELEREHDKFLQWKVRKLIEEEKRGLGEKNEHIEMRKNLRFLKPDDVKKNREIPEEETVHMFPDNSYKANLPEKHPEPEIEKRATKNVPAMKAAIIEEAKNVEIPVNEREYINKTDITAKKGSIFEEARKEFKKYLLVDRSARYEKDGKEIFKIVCQSTRLPFDVIKSRNKELYKKIYNICNEEDKIKIYKIFWEEEYQFIFDAIGKSELPWTYVQKYPNNLTTGWKFHIYGETVEDARNLLKRFHLFLEKNKRNYKFANGINLEQSRSLRNEKALVIYIEKGLDLKKFTRDVITLLKGYPKSSIILGDAYMGGALNYRYELDRPIGNMDITTCDAEEEYYLIAGAEESSYNIPGNPDPFEEFRIRGETLQTKTPEDVRRLIAETKQEEVSLKNTSIGQRMAGEIKQLYDEINALPEGTEGEITRKIQLLEEFESYFREYT